MKKTKCDRCGLIFDEDKAVECRETVVAACKNAKGNYEAITLCQACKAEFNEWMWKYED